MFSIKNYGTASAKIKVKQPVYLQSESYTLQLAGSVYPCSFWKGRLIRI